MNFRTFLVFGTLMAFSSVASEQDVLVTMDFVLNAGASQSRTFKILTPEHVEQLVMVGFNPVKALSVDCTLRLYSPSNKLVGTYSCHQLENHFFKAPLPAVPGYSAQIEVTNSNFTTANTSFSVINRFKFVSVVK
ncbi:MAG: hypothetical protein KKF22_07205 [Gammaproteobacteria bacterium]|nr:hypothetical protein [Gammaproteobacteria bacterium]